MEHKISKISEKTFENASKINGKKINKSRRTFIGLYVSAIIFGRQIQSQEVAVHLDSSATIVSSTKRVKRFLELYTIDYEYFTILMLHFIPPGPVKLCMDRTNWKFGSVSINFLVISAYANGIGIPIWFELLDNKGGNSNTNDRISALDQCIELLGKDRIDCFIADREFIGKRWINFLLTNHLNFYIRVRQNQWVEIEGKRVQIENLLKNKAKNYEFDNVGIFDTYLSMGLKYLPRKDECLAATACTQVGYTRFVSAQYALVKEQKNIWKPSRITYLWDNERSHKTY